jgi:hypothetical protein
MRKYRIVYPGAEWKGPRIGPFGADIGFVLLKVVLRDTESKLHVLCREVRADTI